MYAEASWRSSERRSGRTLARIEVSKDRRRPGKVLRLLVDTGADYSVLFRRELTKVGVEPEFEEDIEIGNGEVITRPVGRVYFRWKDRLAETFVAFGEPRDVRVLGAYAFEGLRLEVDPKSRRLRPRRRAMFFRMNT